MYNVFLDELPNVWNGYTLNTWYQIGVQIYLLEDDEELSKEEKTSLIIQLLFSNEDGSIREFPQSMEELSECIGWFLSGWFTDRSVDDGEPKKKVLDYDIDQWRIYADFLSIYHIDLSTSDMHWWAFQGLLWSMPYEQSSLMKVLEIRQKKPRKDASAEERRQIQLAHQRYDLKQSKKEKIYTSEEKTKIDSYDAMMAEARAKRAAKKAEENEALQEFLKGK